MQEEQNIYVAIDLKSFYASVECRERNLDPMKTNLVVADESRTSKTICLAVSPSLKQYGIPGRARLFEVIKKVNEVNLNRKRIIKNKEFIGSSFDKNELEQNKNLKLDYIAAPPRMALYMDYSTRIYNVYLKYFSPEDIYVYSVDEVFCDVTHYLKTYKLNPRQLVTRVVNEVYNQTGITATAGIGTNLYLAKVAMDIEAKHANEDSSGVRIAELNEMTYRINLWNHKPITDFWRVGKGYANRLAKYRIFTMGDVAKVSHENEDLLYSILGINAELLIDHAWGFEPCTIKDIKSYKPETKSLSEGQVLSRPYNYEDTKIIIKEMAENVSLELVYKKLVTNQMVLTIEYDVENLTNEEIRNKYNGQVTIDRYGRKVPKHAHGTINLDHRTSSTKTITKAVMELYDKIIDKKLYIRRIYIIANNVVNEKNIQDEKSFEQIDLFTNYEEKKTNKIKEQKEKKIQKALIDIKNKYGRNAIIKGMDLQENATAISRNKQVGGHQG